MVASLAGVSIGTDVMAISVAVSSKSVDAGKLFAMSFSAQIAPTESAEINTASGQVETGQQPSTNGGAEKMNADGDADVSKVLVVPRPPSTAGPMDVIQKATNNIVPSDAKTAVTRAAMRKTGAPQAAPLNRSVDEQGTTATDFASGADVLSDGSNNSFTNLQTQVLTDSQEAAPAVKSEQIAEVATDAGAPVQSGLTQQGALKGGAVQVEVPVSASCPVAGALSEDADSFGTATGEKSSVDDAMAVKKSAKKQDDGKDAALLKASDVVSGSAGIPSPNSFASVPVPGQVVVASTLCAAATPNLSECKPQGVSKVVVKSISGYTVPVNQKSAPANTVDSDKGPAKQIVAAGKAAVGGAAPKLAAGSEQAMPQKSDVAAKASGPVNSAMGVIVAKPQGGDGAVSSVHLTASATAGVVSVAASNSVLHAAVASQKSVGADVSASVAGAHADHGESSGVQMQMMDGGHRTLVVTPTVLEVGIPNGTQGWLKVRAELAGSGVNASVSAASSAGQEMLHRELPALSAYLQQEKVAVNSVVVHAPAGGALRDLSGGFGNGGGGQMQGRGQGGRQASTAGQSFFTGSHVSEDDEALVSAQNVRGGGWLSVRA